MGEDLLSGPVSGSAGLDGRSGDFLLEVPLQSHSASDGHKDHLLYGAGGLQTFYLSQEGQLYSIRLVKGAVLH